MEPVSGTVSALAASSSKVAEIDTWSRVSTPTFLTIVLSATGVKLVIASPTTEMELEALKTTAFPRAEFFGSTQKARVRVKNTVAGNVTIQCSEPSFVTVIPVVDPSNVAERLVDEFSVNTILCTGTAKTGWASSAASIAIAMSTSVGSLKILSEVLVFIESQLCGLCRNSQSSLSRPGRASRAASEIEQQTVSVSILISMIFVE